MPSLSTQWFWRGSRGGLWGWSPIGRGRTYEAQLAEVGMTTLEDRRARGDMIATYKVLSVKDRVEPSLLFGLPENGTGLQTRRAAGVHPIRTQLVKPKLDIRRNSFSQRVVSPWNALPARVKGC